MLHFRVGTGWGRGRERNRGRCGGVRLHGSGIPQGSGRCSGTPTAGPGLIRRRSSREQRQRPEEHAGVAKSGDEREQASCRSTPEYGEEGIQSPPPPPPQAPARLAARAGRATPETGHALQGRRLARAGPRSNGWQVRRHSAPAGGAATSIASERTGERRRRPRGVFGQGSRGGLAAARELARERGPRQATGRRPWRTSSSAAV